MGFLSEIKLKFIFIMINWSNVDLLHSQHPNFTEQVLKMCTQGSEVNIKS